MVTVTNGEWIANLISMTCGNVLNQQPLSTNKIVIGFEKKGKFPLGKIKYMPMDLFIEPAAEPRGELKIAKLVMEAREVFFRAFIESDFARQDLMYEDLKNT